MPYKHSMILYFSIFEVPHFRIKKQDNQVPYPRSSVRVSAFNRAIPGPNLFYNRVHRPFAYCIMYDFSDFLTSKIFKLPHSA